MDTLVSSLLMALCDVRWGLELGLPGGGVSTWFPLVLFALGTGATLQPGEVRQDLEVR